MRYIRDVSKARNNPVTADPSSGGGVPPEIAAMTYEQAVEALEEIIDRIEQGEIGLEQSIAEYRRGVLLLRRCEAVIGAAEQQVKELSLGEVERLAAEPDARRESRD